MRNEVATGGCGEEVVERYESRLQWCVGGVIFEVTCDVAIVFIATLGIPTDWLRTSRTVAGGGRCVNAKVFAQHSSE